MNGSASLLQQRLLEVAALFDVSGSAHIENSCAGAAWRGEGWRGATQWVRARMTRHLVRCTGYAICHAPDVICARTMSAFDTRGKGSPASSALESSVCWISFAYLRLRFVFALHIVNYKRKGTIIK